MDRTRPVTDPRPIQSSDLDQPTPCLRLTPAQLYSNLPLGDNRTIRLLDLNDLPSKSDNDETPLSGTLRVVSLATKPRFTALSYVWGTFSIPHADTLELRHSVGQDIKLGISTNCRDALRALRRRYGGLRIWVDAICINQDDEAERSSQINLMEDIYSWATVVYAWLGPSTDASDRVMDWARQLAKHDFLNVAFATCPPTRRNQLKYSSIAMYHMAAYFSRVMVDICVRWIRLLAALGKMIVYRRRPILDNVFSNLVVAGNCRLRLDVKLEIEDLRDLSNREWFRRAWTFQEVVLSSNVILICGCNHVEWTKIVTAFRIGTINDGLGTFGPRKRSAPMSKVSPLPIHDLARVWAYTERPTTWNDRYLFVVAWLAYGEIYWDIYSTWASLVMKLRINTESTRNTYLAGVFRAIRARQASNAKDRSYAAYGVLQRLGVQNLSQPEYSKQLGQVYQELARDLLKWSPQAICLLVDAGTCSYINRPSWIPDWRIAAERQWIHSDYIINPVEPVATPIPQAWIEFRGNNKLVVKGVRNGAIKFNSRPFHKIGTHQAHPHSSVDIEAATSILKRWLKYLIRDSTTHEDYQPLSKAAARILTTDIDSKPDLDLTGEDFFTWYKVLINDKVNLQGHTGNIYDSHPQGDVAKALTVKIYNHLAGRRNLFTTTNGLAGSGPEGMNPGDIVMLIAGIHVPMILRRVADDGSGTNSNPAYRIIGPAYVYGPMKRGFKECAEKITLV
ncbi:heterokaryon incompatibility protein-domain-containing protein [Annulohypoxylon maeteangense]|uniref:heterokaryon incompatibility protein-domain-containing protein n=1 Tax=Annulohypoxylon maeteangense TaxID=1927788 RepID=UPI00200844CE|nr:heterokaryon incompatibility protein-domain-containing protein [Annulohypoxylon maeteangense]KAI0885988.1 heterokaryon incompatibility protein-domain-containing protein [Annulohypoxylon maeteangense]